MSAGNNFDFISKYTVLTRVSLLLALASLVLVFTLKPNYGIDFKGGSDMILKFQGEVSAQEVREAASEAGFSDASVQRFGSEDKHEFMVQTSTISVVDDKSVAKMLEALSGLGTLENRERAWSEERPDRLDLTFESKVDPEKIEKTLLGTGLVEKLQVKKLGRESDAKYVVRFQDLQSRVREAFAEIFPKRFDPDDGLERLETVGPRVGEQLRNSGIVSILVALFFILLYVAFRFGFRYAPGAIVALVHDVVIALGFLTAARLEISLPIIAAMLAIVGYSLNDTIVVFDRIRENLTEGAGRPLSEIVNESLNQTLSRTLITSITTLIAVISIAVLGIGLIRDFAITLIVGVLVGTYSSIFIASPVFLAMDSYLQERRERSEILAERDAAEEAEIVEE
jgi:preprotein translocase subunit SecF